MRLEQISVSGFRGFNRECQVPIGANVVILKGPNGSGKTSLIDAIQWLLLGDISRFRGAVLKKGEDYISNRYAGGPPFVAAELSGDQGPVRVSRRGIGDAMQLQVEGHELPDLLEDDAQAWLDETMGAEFVETKPTELLRRHLLQQDEMREFLQADTNERYEFVASLTGMERLTSLDNQLTSELKSTRQAARDLQTRVEEAESELASANVDRADTRQLLEERTVPADFEGAAKRAAALLSSKEAPTDPTQLSDTLSARSGEILEELEGLEENRRRRQLADQQARESGADASQLAELRAKVDTLGSEERQARERLVKAEEGLAAARITADKAQQLAALAFEQIEGACPVCGQEHNYDETRARLERLLQGAPELAEEIAAVDAAGAEVAGIAAGLADARSRLAELETAAERHAEAERSIEHLEAERKKAQERLKALVDAPTKGSEEALEESATTRRAEIDTALTHLRRGLERELGNRRTARRVTALDEQVGELQARLDELRKELSAQRTRVKRAEEVRKNLGRHINAVMGKATNSSTELINEIYRRLDVHPTFQEFGFHTQRHYETGHLRPWVYDRRRGRDGNALHVLSAAQLNSLAICLFLALNLESRSGLSTAILDDPVQSLDDVNLLSLADVLRTVRSKRQVIVSTHDEILAELLIRKLRPLRSEDATVVVTIDQWGESGPRLRSETREGARLEPELELLRDHSA
ncbi:MAG TPA: AAA family ATPase [Solirubrobacterales bacterium]|nr:AAA family ATPase [Solirubrobacterales bacterium]